MLQVKKVFYWPGWRKDTSLFVTECAGCLHREEVNLKRVEPFNNRQKTSMMSCAWALLNKNKYILMMLDQFSHFCTVVPIPNNLAKTVSTAILTHWIALYGTPTKIRIDAGLDSTIISMMSSLNVKKLMGRMIGKTFTHCDSCI